SDLSHLASLINLSALYLGHNHVSDLSPLASFTNLTILDLENNQISDLSPLTNLTNLCYLNLEANNIVDVSPLLENSGLSKGDTVIWKDNPLSPESEDVYIPQLKKRGVAPPREKTHLGYLNIGHLLIPLFVLLAALVAVLLGYPTQHERRARRRRKWLVAGVIVAGLYTFCALLAVAAGGMQPIDLEDLLLFVVAPGLFLYGGVAVAWFLWSTRERKQQHKEEPE
ncbi:leucine-rich repeat domain-containing protein, partial [Chloroflexota bacterium]